MRRIAHQTTGWRKHAVEAGSGWEFQPGERVVADGLPGVVASVDDTNPYGIESYQIVLDNGLGGGEYTAAQLQRPQSATASLVDQQAATESLGAVESASTALASHWYPELGTILTDRLPNERIEVTAGLRRTAGHSNGGHEHMDAEQFDTNPDYRQGYQHGLKGETSWRDEAQARVDTQRHDAHDVDYLVGHDHGTEQGRTFAQQTHNVRQMLDRAPEYNSVEHQVDMLGHELRHEGMGQAGPDYDNLSFKHMTGFEYGAHPDIQHHELLFAQHPDHGYVGRIHYDATQHPGEIDIQNLSVNPEHQRRGVASQLMAELERRNPGSVINHGPRTPDGTAWAQSVYGDEGNGGTSRGAGEGWSRGRPTRDGRPLVSTSAVEAEPDVEELNEPDACSWCGNPGPWVDEQDTGRGTRIRCGTCGGTMRINTDAQSGTSGIQWTPEFNNSPENHASRQGDPRARVNDLASVHARLNVMATEQAGYAIFHEPELHEVLTKQLSATAASLNGYADEDFVFAFTATWADVRKKATRIRSEGGVRILAASNAGVVGEVQGDQAIYESAFNYVLGSKKIADWQCGCKWAAYAWGRSPGYQRFEGRQCSHVLALQYEAQSRGMFGAEVSPDRDRMDNQHQRTPVQVQYQRPTERHPGGDITRRTVPPGNMRSEWAPGSRVRVKGVLAYQYEDVPPTHEWARLFTALGTPPSEVMQALHSLGVPHSAARAALDWATNSLASAVMATDDGTVHTAVHVEGGFVHTASGEVLPADALRLVLAADKKQEATADPMGGQAEPGSDIPRLDKRDQSDAKRKKHHVLHHTNDGRMHAPDWGHGLPWGGSYLWCDQCNGSGCGHCGGTGQVLAPQDGSPGPSEGSTTNSPMADQSVDAGDMIGGDGGGMSATGAVHEAGGTGLGDASNFAARLDKGPDEEPYLHPHREEYHRDYTAPTGQTYRLLHNPPGSGGDTITAHQQLSNGQYRGVGYLTWFGGKPGENTGSNTDSGTIYKTHVSAPHRRRGIASAMLDYAREKHPEMNIRHSNALSEDGKAWAQAKASLQYEADYSVSDFGAGNPAQTYQQVTPHANTPNPASTGWAASADPQGWTRPLVDSGFGTWESMLHHGFVMTASGDTSKPPTVAGVALKAADTGRVLMIQRSNNDEKDPARGTWEFPGGHREEGDQTSLHAGIREFEEEVGQPFPTGGHLTHVHRSGPYVLHTVVVPKESEALDFASGRSTVNPDDPKGTEHEQSAWWDPTHAKKNPALRQECKSSPWGEISKAASHGSVTTADSLRGNPDPATYKQAEAGYNPPVPPCPTCGGPRSIEIDPSTTEAEPFRWCEHCATGTFPEDEPQHHHGRFLTVDEARAASGASNQAEAAQMLHEHHQWQEGFFPADQRVPSPYLATLHDEPEPALPSTDGAVDDDDVATALGYGDDDSPEEATPGVPLAREAPWGYPESAADHPDPQVAQPGSADVMPEGDEDNDDNGLLMHSVSALDVPPEMAAVAAANPAVAGFMQTAGFRALMTDSSPQGGGVEAGDVPNDSDIAKAAREMLTKTSMKSFSFAEQQELINEGGGKARARNFHALQVAGTHYERLGEDDAPDEFLLL